MKRSAFLYVSTHASRLLFVALMALTLAACGMTGSTALTVASTSPLDAATGVGTNSQITASFSDPLNSATLTTTTFMVTGPGITPVAGTVSLDTSNTTAVFTPASSLAVDTEYTVTLATGIEDAAGNALANPYVWTFTTSAVAAVGEPVFLGTAADFAILAKTAISTTGTTNIVGDIGVSPAAQTYITGFSETMHASGEYATSSLVNGRIYAADMAAPTPAMMTNAIGDMQIAYTDAAGRTSPDFTEVGAGAIGGMDLEPGLYKWGTGVSVNTDVTLTGGSNDVWIFQIAEDLTVANGVAMILAGGAVPENIFWQVAGQVTLGTTSEFNGIALTQTQVEVQTGAVVNGRLLAQTAVTLDANDVTAP